MTGPDTPDDADQDRDTDFEPGDVDDRPAEPDVRDAPGVVLIPPD